MTWPITYTRAMGLIDELLLDGVLSELGPSTSRGLLVLATLFGLGITGASGWMLLRGIDPLSGPAWAFGVLCAAVVFAPVEFFFGFVVARREPDARVFATVAMLANAGALLSTIAAGAVH